MKLQTTRHGHIEEQTVAPQDVIGFPRGPIGFEEHCQFALLGDPGQRPFYLLQSLLDPWTAFVVVDISSLWSTYRLSTPLPEGEAPQSGEEQLVLGIVTLGTDAEDATTNLLAPIVINLTKRVGRQVVQCDGCYSLAEPLFASSSSLAPAAGG
jgi:flagellar assembly factor FliW